MKKDTVCLLDREIERSDRLVTAQQLIGCQEALCVVGLGYVGMPLAAAFAEAGMQVVGFDTNRSKIACYRSGIDPTNELGDARIQASTVAFTYDEMDIRRAKFIIVAVPTPVGKDHIPDLTPVICASEVVGRNLSKGAVVVYESTVYPGVTEEVCIPILEKNSGLKIGIDFSVGYSPERINPGDRVHRLSNIVKIVSGYDEETLRVIQAVYNQIVEVGTHSVSSIKTAEAVKLLENSQRDINIAFINEAAKVCNLIGIDTNEVVDGMNTKWNALNFRPGLVGGHCIGVDPYYFTHEAEKLGYHSQIVRAGRLMNESMAAFVCEETVKQIALAGFAPRECKVAILGITFKENCPDIRNSKIYDLVCQLRQYGIQPLVVDPWADSAEVMREYGIQLHSIEAITGNMDCVIAAVSHRQFQELGEDGLMALYTSGEQTEHVLIDVKGMYSIQNMKRRGVRHWRL